MGQSLCRRRLDADVSDVYFFVEVKTMCRSQHIMQQKYYRIRRCLAAPPFFVFLTKLRAIAFVYFLESIAGKMLHYVGIWESSGCMIDRMICTGGSNCRTDSIGDENVRTMFSKMVKECGLKIDYGRKYCKYSSISRVVICQTLLYWHLEIKNCRRTIVGTHVVDLSNLCHIH